MKFYTRIIPVISYGIRKQVSPIVTKKLLPTARSFSSNRNNNNVFERFVESVKSNNFAASIAIGAVGTIVLGLAPYYSFIKEVHEDTVDLKDKLKIAIETSQITHSLSRHFVHRPNIEEKIKNVLTGTDLSCGAYTIVYGPKGIGKTELVDHTAIRMKGVVKVNVYSEKEKKEVIQAVIKNLVGEKEGNSNFYNLNVTALIEAATKCSVIPTIIFDVSHPDYCDAVRSVSKDLAPYCRCIIVLSEPNAVLKFGRDMRERFIYVDEMEREEAKQLLGKYDEKNKELKGGQVPTLTEAEMDYVFTTIGTSPLCLIHLANSVSSNYSVYDYVANFLQHAKQDLVSFPHKQILKALKDHPEGVAPKYFKNQENQGIDLSNPQEVGIAMKSSNAIVYRRERIKYMLLSTAHRTALKSYKPPDN